MHVSENSTVVLEHKTKSKLPKVETRMKHQNEIDLGIISIFCNLITAKLNRYMALVLLSFQYRNTRYLADITLVNNLSTSRGLHPMVVIKICVYNNIKMYVHQMYISVIETSSVVLETDCENMT